MRLEKIEQEKERRAKNAEEAKAAEELAAQKLIEELKEMGSVIADGTAGTSPFAEQINLCDELIKYCAKNISVTDTEE